MYAPIIANYAIVRDKKPNYVILQDLGPHYLYPTITNSAERVVEELDLPKGCKLYYYDSENELSEIMIQDRLFGGFKHVPKHVKEMLESE